MKQRISTSRGANRPGSAPRLRIRLGLTALLLTTCLSPLSAQDGLLQLDDLRLETNLSDPQLSPDGRFAVVVTSKPNYEDNRFDRSLVLVDLGDGTRLDLTPHRPKVRQPRWSPDGSTIAFLDAGSDDDKPQLYLLPTRGGEAAQLSKAKGGVNTYAWSADASEIYFTGVILPEEVEGEERHNKSFEVGYNSYLTKESPRPGYLWRISVDDGEVEQMTEGEENIRSIAVAPDGQKIAYELTPDADTGSGIRTRVRLRDLEDGSTINLDGPQPMILAEFSPDGSALAIAGPVGPEPYFNPMGLFMADADNGYLRYASGNIDRQIMDMGWLPDGESLLFGGVDLNETTYWMLAGDGSPERLDLGGVHPRAPAISDTGTIVFVGQENERPEEIYTMTVGEWRPKRLTDFNAELDAKSTGAVETVSWSGPDGFDQNGILIYPPGYEEGRKYPLVLVIHGGPMGASTEAFSLTRQLMAARGWLESG
jgi:dipeptidyl aminopeptidase/acylaminoacyl peptidase